MKKSLFIFLLCISTTLNAGYYYFNCLCSNFLIKTYMGVESFIIDENLTVFLNNIDSVENTLDKNIDILNKDITIIEDMNKNLKFEIAQLSEYKTSLNKTKDQIFLRE